MITLLSEREAAKLVSVSIRTIQQWRLRGEGPPFLKIGRAVRYSVEDIERWIETRRRTSTSDPGEE